MEEVFFISPNDKGLSILLKREANIILASLNKESNEYFYKKERFEETLSVVRAIEYTEPQSEDEIDFILNTIGRIWNTGILSPLTLKKDEFLNYTDLKGYLRNTRYNDIYIDIDINQSICNDNAFNLYIRAAYSHDNKEQIYCADELVYKNHRIYISKGGVITGEYIEKCIIRKDIVEKHSFTIQSIPTVPVCIIYDKDSFIYVVDHRDPKLKALREFYDVPIEKDETVANKHYNLRKYIKLKKQ